MNLILSIILLLLSGVALTFAFAPFNQFILAFIAPAIFLYFCYRAKNYKRAFLYGLIFGIGFFGSGVYWVYVSVHVYGGASVIMAVFISALLISFLALFKVTQALVLKYLFKHRPPIIVALAGFPAVWVFWEWLRELPFNGFPWLYLGYSQMLSPLKGYAPWLGIYGLSLIVCIISANLFCIYLQRSAKAVIIHGVSIAALLLGGFLLGLPTWTQPAFKPIKVSLVQGDIAQSVKWQSQQLNDTLNLYNTLTLKHLDSRLIIWPEAAVPMFPEQVYHYISELNRTLKTHNASLIFGAPITDAEQRYYNGLLLIGKDHGVYSKRHLVPFGEYTPLGFIFQPLMKHLNIPASDFSAGKQQQAHLKVDQINIVPFICYEIAFPKEVLNSVKDSNILITLSDDSWFDATIALDQHLQMAEMRSLETGRPNLVTTNTGITAFINSRGKVIVMAPLGEAYVLTHDVTPMRGTTPLMFWGYYPVVALILLMLGVLVGKRKV